MARIGIDARLLAYRKGGIAEYMRQLIRALSGLDGVNEYQVIRNFRDKNLYAEAANFRHIQAFTPPHHRLERTALSVELAWRGLDILHSPDFIPPRRGARHHLITIHDLHFLHYPDFQTADSRRYYAGQIEAAVQQADHIFAQTKGTKAEIVTMLGVPEDKITVHHLGVHPVFTRLDTEQVGQTLARYDLEPGYILFVGTIEPRKNIPGLLKAYALLREKHSSIPPLVLGGQKGWNAEESLETISRLGLETAVRWVDDVPFDVLPALYNGARLLVLPSFHEGFGMPAVEAMACGVPVVIAQRGSLPEVVGNWGVYIDPEDIDSITDGIWQVLENEDLAQRLKQGGLDHAANYTWERTAEIALDVYRRFM